MYLLLYFNIVNREGKRLTSLLNNKFNKIVVADRVSKGIQQKPNITITIYRTEF